MEVQRVCNLTREFTRLFSLPTYFFLVVLPHTKTTGTTHERTSESKKQGNTTMNYELAPPPPLASGFATLRQGNNRCSPTSFRKGRRRDDVAIHHLGWLLSV